MKRIAVLGAGAMGSRIVQNLLNAKYQVVVYNRTASKVKPLLDRGAVYATTPKEAAEQADIVISMVTDNDVSRSIWLDPKIGAALGLSKDAITIESSTLTVDWTRELADEILNRGLPFSMLQWSGRGSRQKQRNSFIWLGEKHKPWHKFNLFCCPQVLQASIISVQ